MEWWLWIPIGIIIAALISLFVGGYIVFVKSCKRKPEREDVFESQFSEYRLSTGIESRLRRDYDWFDANRTSELCITSEDGLRLHATLIEAPKDMTPKGVIILVHGFRSNIRRDFCMHVPLLHKEGYHIIAVDQRSHSKSEGKYITYGVRESSDIMRWRDKAAELYGRDMPIILFGLSMGGATVLMASGRVPKDDKAVKCIIADCPLSSARNIIYYVMKTFNNMRPEPLLTFAGFWSRWLAGFDIRSKTTAEVFATSHLDALLFHGDADDFVPPIHSEYVINAAPDRARLIMFEGAKHAEAIYYDEKKYMDSVLGFINEHLKETDQ